MRWKQWLVGGAALAGLAAGGAILQSNTSGLPADNRVETGSTGTIRVDGMTCAGCAVAVQMAAGKVDGVTSVEVNLEEKQAHVTFDPARTTPSAIARAIREGTGFAAEPLPPIRNERKGT